METEHILDRDHLARYTLGDPGLEQEVLSLFLNQLPATLACLRGSDEPDAWMRAAHTIKGSARAVGAWKLAGAAERAEQGWRETEHWEDLANAIEVALEELRCRIAG